MSAKLLLLTGATILSLVFGAVGTAAALPEEPTAEAEGPARRGALVYGLIEEIEGETLSLATPLGTVALITDANTRFRIPDVEDPGLDDGSTEHAEVLAVGDTVGAAGWWEEGSSVFHAFGVARLESDRAFPLPGTLADIGDDALTVETRYGSATVHVDGETVYHIRDVEEAGLDDLEVGMTVVVKGTLNPDGSLQAQVVAVLWVGPRPVRLRGEVLVVEGGTFTVRTARGREVTVLTDEATEFRVPGVESPSIADLQVGDKVAGEGVVEEDGAGSGEPIAKATLVVVLPDEVARLAGEVSAIEGTTLVLETRGGVVNVLTDAETIFRIPGVEEPTLADIEVGNPVIAAGTWEDEVTFHAIGVGVGGRREGQPGVVRGRAISVEIDSLVIGTPRGPVTVLVDDETRYRVPGVDDPGLDDIEVGAWVGARGAWNEDGALQATGVALLQGRWRRAPVSGRR
jgi:hypothetical protein